MVKAPIALVTTFGLARTPAQIGMLNSLAEREIPFDYAVGTSLGSVNVPVVCAGAPINAGDSFVAEFTGIGSVTAKFA